MYVPKPTTRAAHRTPKNQLISKYRSNNRLKEEKEMENNPRKMSKSYITAPYQESRWTLWCNGSWRQWIMKGELPRQGSCSR